MGATHRRTPAAVPGPGRAGLPAPAAPSSRAAPLLLGALLALAAACAGPRGRAGAPAAARAAPVRAEDLERVAAEVVHALEGADAVRALEGRRPLLVVGRVRNGTREPVDTQALADRLASGLARTGRFTLQGAGEREAVAEEEAAPGPRGAATPPPATPPSADYLLTGDVTSRVEGEGPEVRVSLWLAVALHDLRTGQVGWRDARVLRAGERPGPGGW